MAIGFDTRAPSTIVTIQLSGQVEFTIPFEFLARKFVVVTLLGADRKVLTLNTDYRFVAANKIAFINVDTSGYTYLELRRVTSTTDRLVTFTDGSILRATDMNLSQVQTMHVAEEARDMTADAIGTNDDGDLDARNRKLVNLSYGTEPNDAVAYGQMQEYDGSALNSKIAAEAARDVALSAAGSAVSSKDAAHLSELNAENYAVQAALSAQDAATARDAATSSKVDAETAADRAEAASGPATEVFTRLQDVEDKVDVANGNASSSVAISQSALIVANDTKVLAETALTPVLSSAWIDLRTEMWNGYAPADGQLLSRAAYPDAWARIAAGGVPVVSDAEWLADASLHGFYTTGDGSTTFRVPDRNGVQPNSFGPVYPSGDGGVTADNGKILQDRIQNITGRFNAWKPFGYNDNNGGFAGAFSPVLGVVSGAASGASQGGNDPNAFEFDASRVARTGSTTRPITAVGCWAIRLFGAVQNAGLVDVVELATEVGSQGARIAALESRTFTTIVPVNLPSGAPHDDHETVYATLPDVYQHNAGVVLANPFGNNTRVECVVELWWNGRWAGTGNYSSAQGGFGVYAWYVQGVGIQVQSGRIGVATNAPDGIGGSGTTDAASWLQNGTIRIFVKKVI